MVESLKNSIPSIRDSKGIGRRSPMEKVRKFFENTRMTIGALKRRASKAKATRSVK